MNNWRHKMVEEVMKDYPRILLAQKNLEQYLISGVWQAGGANETFVQGGNKRYQQERYLELPLQGRLEQLNRIVDVVANAMDLLDCKAKNIITLTCFNGRNLNDAAELLGISRDTVKRIRKRSFALMQNTVLCVAHDIEEWREWEKEQVANSLDRLRLR